MPELGTQSDNVKLHPVAGFPSRTGLTLRPSEWIFAGYFTYTAVLGFLLPVRPQVPVVVLLLNLAVISGFVLLAYADSFRRGRFLGTIRNWYPYPLMLLAYREMGWFAPVEHTYELEQNWIVWDKLLLNDWGLKKIIEFSGPVLPSILEISYLLVYLIPAFSIAVLYAYRLDAKVERFLTLFALGILIPYALFPYFPSEPPRTVFPGQDFPSIMTPFRAFNWSLLGNYGIHTSVFPSAHVSAAFSAAFAVFRTIPDKKWVSRLLLVMAILIAIAVVYGRYHYAVDALAGFAASVLALGISAAIDWRRSLT